MAALRIVLSALAYRQILAATECLRAGVEADIDGLSLLQRRSEGQSTVCHREKKYVLNGTNTKCAYQHSDRLFREENKDTDSCYEECKQTENCNYFSIALTGPYAGVCMGCTYGATDPHDHFMFYAMCPGLHGECSVAGDPHVTGFDSMSYSLVDTDGFGHDVVDVYGSGVYWLVKSDKIQVQAMYNKVLYPKSKQPLSHTYMTALAVGGTFLDGHILLVEPGDGTVSWKGNGKMRSILSTVPSTFQDFNQLMNARATESAGPPAAADENEPVSSASSLDFLLPSGVKLHVDRYDKHLDMKISMARAAAGTGDMTGQCGNFNGDEHDDDQAALMGQKVQEAEWLMKV